MPNYTPAYDPFYPLFPRQAEVVAEIQAEVRTTPQTRTLNKFVFYYDHKRKRGVKACTVLAYTFRGACEEFMRTRYPALKHNMPNHRAYWIKFTRRDCFPEQQMNIRNWLDYYHSNTDPTALF